MEPVHPVRVKVCCIASREEARLAVAHGASALGLVGWMPSGPGVLEEPLIRDIADGVPPGVSRFLLSCAQDVATLAEQARRAGVDTLQVVDALHPDALLALRTALPGVRLVQVVHVRGPESVDEALALAPLVDALLLDSGNPAAAVKELGGTGRVHDWALSRTIRERAPVPVWLAGGLTPRNVRDALAAVRPFGLDVCSGLREDGRLSERRLVDFMAAVRAAAAGA